jgi:hypothetical protein|tara:strand:- start:358 stop:489 length:132 start_codon:yes stop_codon:yes gene_type:complete
MKSQIHEAELHYAVANAKDRGNAKSKKILIFSWDLDRELAGLF